VYIILIGGKFVVHLQSPEHLDSGILHEIMSCMTLVLPTSFYEGSLEIIIILC
jgi:hypothetical protein